MSTRDDATLTEQERAAFARLKAQAIADDPSLGAPLIWRLGHAGRSAAGMVGRLLQRPWAGPVVMVLGVAAVVAGLIVFLPISVAGLVLIAAGAVPIAERIQARIDAPPPGEPSA